jgi:hypothetical protein
MSISNTTSISSVTSTSVSGSHRSPPISTTPERALENITAADRPLGKGLAEWYRLSSVEQLGVAIGLETPKIQFARADVVGSTVRIRPESDIRSDLPKFDIPNNVGAKGFSPGITTHDYIVTNEAPLSLQGPVGLAAVGRALVANPTPGVDAASTPTGTRNNVGGLVWGDGGTNFVKSYVIPSSDPKRSDAVVNYTIAGEHTMAEGFVMRFAELRPNGRIELVTYGEGNALKQTEALSLIWEPIVKDVWTMNAQETFASAQAGVNR